MAYTIEKKITKVNKGVAGANKPEWIIFHFVGASGQAQDNANYFYSVYREASAHYFVDPNKIIQVVPDNTPAWHIGDGKRTRRGKNNGYVGRGATNNNAIGVELCQDTSTGSDVWNWDFHPETVNKALWLIKKLQRKYNIPDSRVIRHYDATAKKCPGNWAHNNWAKWWAFKKRLAGVSGGEVTGNPGKTDGKPSTSTKQHLVKAGETLSGIAKKYGKTVDQLVSWNGLKDPNLIFPESYLVVEKPTTSKPQPYTQDAKYPKKTNYGPNVLAVQKLLNKNGYKVAEDSSFGPDMDRQLRRFQKDKGLAVDGQAGPATQSALNKGKAKLSVDGSWGPATTRALQKHYGTTIDGKITGQPNNASVRNIPSATTSGSGSLLVKAMQKDLGTTQDGKISHPSNMIKALQKRLGTTQDGKVSRPSLVVKEMQRRLNNGTF